MRIELIDLISAIRTGKNQDTQDWEAYCAFNQLRDEEEVIAYLQALFCAGYHTVARRRAATWCDNPKAVMEEFEKLLLPLAAE